MARQQDTVATFDGGNPVEICGCIDTLVSIDNCKLEYAFPDSKSAWSTMVYCTNVDAALGESICYGTMGSGWILTAEILSEGKRLRRREWNNALIKTLAVS